MRRLLALAVAALAVLAVAAAAPSDDGLSQPGAGEARCKVVTRIVRGKRTRVRVCPAGPRARPKPRADLAVAATFAPSPAQAGGTLTYTLAIRNHGPAAATRTVTAHVIPVELRATHAAASRGSCALPPAPPSAAAPSQLSAVACRLGNLPARATATVTIEVTVRGITRRTLEARAAVASAPTRDPVPANNSAVVRTPVEGNCDPAYPTVCIPPPEPALACAAIPYTDFPSQAPDPHKLDLDADGVACESVAGDPTDAPLVGAAYGHWRTVGCDAGGAAILTTYHEPGVRQRVRQQLAAMRAAGLETLRLVIWHQTDGAGQPPGVIPSAGGQFVEPYRGNLARYLQDVRAARFERLTVAFRPRAANDPTGDVLDPVRFEENLSFVAAVRPLLKQFGPAATRVDLLAEGVATDDQATRDRVKAYVTELYRRYVNAFGKGDVTASAVARPDGAASLQDLITAFAASGHGQPEVFSVRPAADGTLEALRQVDATLTANGLAQPIVITETAYDDAPLAAAIQEFRRTSPRRVVEVQQRPVRRGSGCDAFSVTPPFRADAYHRALRGTAPPARLTARVASGRIQVLTAYGHPATALRAGSYTVVAVDRSKSAGVQLSGPRVARRTGARFFGSERWRLRLRAGTYVFRAAPSGSSLSLTVLAGG